MPIARRLRIACICVVAALASAGRGTGAPADSPEPRFSASLEVPERTACGLSRLSSDELAVVDALVRRDTERRGSTNQSAVSQSDRADLPFSGRLTAEERKTAGIERLTPVELSRLEAAIERHQNARLAWVLLAPPTFLARRNAIIPAERKTEREIHGSFSLSYGFGSGGYREKSGSMVLNFEDPARRYSVTIGYTETHIKGGAPFYLRRDPLADSSILPADPLRP